MYRRLILGVILCFIVEATVSQPFTYHWATGFGGRAQYTGNVDLAYSNFGILYTTGDFTSTRSFGPTITKTAVGYSDVYISVLDTGGNTLWTTTGGDLFSYGYASSVAVDFSSNVYAVGYFTGGIKFGTFTVNSVGQSDIFIVKLDFAGNPVWLKRAGGSLFDEANGLFCDGQHLYMTGYFTGSTSFDTFSLTSGGTNDTEIFVAKYDLNGNCVWAKSAGSSGEDSGGDITKDAAGDICVIGEFSGTASFGSNMVTSVGNFDVFVAKYDDNGNNSWVTRGGGGSNDFGVAIGYDNSNNIYVSGNFADTATFGSYTVLDNGYTNVFVSKLNASGAWQWARGGGSASGDGIFDMSVRKNDGNIYVTGFLNGAGSFGTKFIPSSGVNDAFIMRYNNAGTEIFGLSIGGSNYDQGKAITADEGGGVVYLIGEYTGNVSVGSHNLPVTAPNNWGQFLTRISTGTVGVPETEGKLPPLQLYPNPVQDYVHVDLGSAIVEAVTIQVTDATGRLVWTDTKKITGRTLAIPVEAWPSGRYTLSVLSGGEAMHTGFIVID